MEQNKSKAKASTKRIANESLTNRKQAAANNTKTLSESLSEWLANWVAINKRLWLMVNGYLYQGVKFNIYNLGEGVF